MTWVDLLLVGIVVASALISLVRGFVREVLSLVVWLAAFWVAAFYAPALAAQLAGAIETEALRLAVAFGGLFVAVLVAGSAVSFFATHLVKVTKLSGANRALGVTFGLARGIVVAVAVVTLLGLTPVAEAASWAGSVLVGYCQTISAWAGDWVPWNKVSDSLLKWVR